MGNVVRPSEPSNDFPQYFSRIHERCDTATQAPIFHHASWSRNSRSGQILEPVEDSGVATFVVRNQKSEVVHRVNQMEFVAFLLRHVPEEWRIVQRDVWSQHPVDG